MNKIYFDFQHTVDLFMQFSPYKIEDNYKAVSLFDSKSLVRDCKYAIFRESINCDYREKVIADNQLVSQINAEIENSYNHFERSFDRMFSVFKGVEDEIVLKNLWEECHTFRAEKIFMLVNDYCSKIKVTTEVDEKKSRGSVIMSMLIDKIKKEA